jgi:hypothetical protein
MLCELCNRDVQKLGNHHLVPRKLLKRMPVGAPSKSPMCVDCNKMVHALFRLKELATKYDTPAKLLAHPEIQNYVQWVRDKPEGIVKHPRRSWKGGKYE